MDLNDRIITVLITDPAGEGKRRLSLQVFFDTVEIGKLTLASGPHEDVEALERGEITLKELEKRWNMSKIRAFAISDESIDDLLEKKLAGSQEDRKSVATYTTHFLRDSLLWQSDGGGHVRALIEFLEVDPANRLILVKRAREALDALRILTVDKKSWARALRAAASFIEEIEGALNVRYADDKR